MHSSIHDLSCELVSPYLRDQLYASIGPEYLNATIGAGYLTLQYWGWVLDMGLGMWASSYEYEYEYKYG